MSNVRGGFYFAYGSNMDERQMLARVPGAVLLGAAVLPDHEFLFSGYSETWGGATANVRKSRGKRVFGLVWDLPMHGFAKLDRFEGHPRVYRRKQVTVHFVDAHIGDRASATLYYKRDLAALAPPSERYVNLILRAIRRHGGSR